jgi:hypothetical protein
MVLVVSPIGGHLQLGFTTGTSHGTLTDALLTTWHPKRSDNSFQLTGRYVLGMVVPYPLSRETRAKIQYQTKPSFQLGFRFLRSISVRSARTPNVEIVPESPETHKDFTL